MNIIIRRPIYNPSLLVPGMDVAINIPSIKAVLAEREYQFITSMAGDNFSEALKVPRAAQWLQQYYTAPAETPVHAISDKQEEDAAASKQSESSFSRQEMFKNAVKADKGKAQPPAPPKVFLQAFAYDV